MAGTFDTETSASSSGTATKSNHSVTGYESPDYHEFIYPSFAFERHVYLVIWECLVIWTVLFNIMVVIILLKRKLRSPTNIILVFIAVSDSLTGLVTLPTYIYVYRHFELGFNADDTGGDNFDGYSNDYSTSIFTVPSGNNSERNSSTYHAAVGAADYLYTDGYTYETMDIRESDEMDFYTLTKAWCQAFMISKFFVSRAFHTVSIWLTVLLGIQRFVYVHFPFRAQKLFTIRRTLVFISLIYIISPWLHVYHLLDEKARDSDGMCQWTLEESCGAGCAYLWFAFLFMHFIPCALLVIFTVLMVIRLLRSGVAATDPTNRGNPVGRNEDNRRITIVVSVIVIVFLIPELPYGLFLLYSVLRRHSHLDIMSLETNRAFHVVYELMLVITFHANFWIYTFMNRRFRVELRRRFSFALGPIYRAIGARFRTPSLTGSFSRSSDTRTMGQTTQGDVQTDIIPIEMTPLQGRMATHDDVQTRSVDIDDTTTGRSGDTE